MLRPSPTVDILVAGGGPAGLATAGSAAALGLRVALVHRDAQFGRPVRTSGGTWKSDMVALGFPASVFHEIHSVSLVSPRHEARFEFGSDELPVILDVTGAYQHLATQAAGAGAELRPGCSFRRVVSSDTGGVLCEVENGAGAPELISAKYVVDATGSARAVLSSLGLAQRPPRFGVGVEYGFEEAGGDPRHVSLFIGERFAPSGYGWSFPTGNGIVRVGIGVIRPDTPRSPAELMTAFLESEEPARLGLKLGKLRDKHFGVIPSEGLQRRFVHGRVVSVGDAAGQALALVGEGIRFSVEAGLRLGETLGRCVHERADGDSALVEYEAWWNGKYRRRFNAAQLVNEQLGKFRDVHWDAGTRAARNLTSRELRRILRMEFTRKQALGWAVRCGPALFPTVLRIVARRLVGGLVG